MNTKILKITCCIFLLLGVISCGTADYYNAHKEFATTESIRMKEQTAIVMEALKIIMTGFEKTATQEKVKTPMYSKTYKDPNTGNVVTENIYSDTGEVLAFMAEYRKPDIIRELMPLVKEIYTQQQLKVEAPVSAGQVALAFVNQIPFMSTVAGMYGLGVEGIKKAGDAISAQVDNGSSFANNGGSSTATPLSLNNGSAASTGPGNVTSTPIITNAPTAPVQ